MLYEDFRRRVELADPSVRYCHVLPGQKLHNVVDMAAVAAETDPKSRYGRRRACRVLAEPRAAETLNMLSVAGLLQRIGRSRYTSTAAFYKHVCFRSSLYGAIGSSLEPPADYPLL